ncbi:hypothetical protein I9Y33_002319 [Clostridium perfringens]|nr:hypothetical protein [Clostridium perfringens]EGT0014432.1 hypothetical protein [Clostridium perfringens]
MKKSELVFLIGMIISIVVFKIVLKIFHIGYFLDFLYGIAAFYYAFKFIKTLIAFIKGKTIHCFTPCINCLLLGITFYLTVKYL